MTARAIDEAVTRVQLDFPHIYFACHVRHRVGRAQGVSDRDVQYLGHLRVDRGVRPKHLAAHLGVADSTLSAFLARMEELGYVERTPCADRRQVELFLTESGRRVICEASVLDRGRLAPILAGMDAAALERALEGLGLLADACRSAREQHADGAQRADDAS